jgi:hypothetical protein
MDNIQHHLFIYVWEPHVADYHRLGWTLANEAKPIYARPRGEHFTYLMQWLCHCPPPYPVRSPYRHAN